MGKRYVFILLAVSTLLITKNSTAASIQFDYEGIFNTEVLIGITDPAPFNAFSGEQVQVSLLFENDPLLNPDQNLDPDELRIDLTSLTMNLAGNTFVGTGGQIRLENDQFYGTPGYVSDLFQASVDVQRSGESVFGPSIGGLPISAISISLQDNSAAVFSDDTLPGIAPDPLNFVPDVYSPQSDITLAFFDPSLPGSVGILRAEGNAQLSAVPVPAAVWLFASALGIVGYSARRKREPE